MPSLQRRKDEAGVGEGVGGPKGLPPGNPEHFFENFL